MELKPGYKQTEVGVIPVQWNLRSICTFAEVRGRVGWKGYTKKDLVAYGPYAIGAKHIDSHNRLDLSDPTFLSATKYLESPEIMVQPGDILIVQRGTIGKLVLIDRNIGDATINPSMVIIRSRNVSPAFVTYYLLSYSGQKQILADTSSTGVPMISQKQIESFQIPTPPTKAEQEVIAEALSDADALIESLEQLITKKRHLKKGAMQELLTGKKRLPGFSGEWEVKRLGNTAFIKARIGWQGLTTAEYLDSGDYYLVTGTDFKEGYIDWSNCHCVAEGRYKQDKNIQLKEHDVLVTKDGTIGKVALINHLDKPATLKSGVFVIRPMEDAFHPDFFYFLLCSTVFTQFLLQLSAGSTINHLYQKDFVDFIYTTPSKIEEQIDIAAILSDMDAEVAALEAKLAKARQIKEGMMQELLTGGIRLI